MVLSSFLSIFFYNLMSLQESPFYLMAAMNRDFGKRLSTLLGDSGTGSICFERDLPEGEV